jgi:large subunit ribosomal protein L18
MSIKKAIQRKRRTYRVRAKIRGTKECPRLSVFRSNRFIYVQLIDDKTGRVLAAAGGIAKVKSGKNDKKASKGKLKILSRKDWAEKVGLDLAKRAGKLGIKKAVFDRGPYKYHGRVKALAEGARKGGLKF